MNWKALGIGTMVLGAGLTLLSSIANNKQQEEDIDRKLDQKVDKKFEMYKNMMGDTIIVEDEEEDEEES